MRGDTSSTCVVPRTTSSRAMAVPVDAGLLVPADRTANRCAVAARPPTVSDRLPGVASYRSTEPRATPSTLTLAMPRSGPVRPTKVTDVPENDSDALATVETARYPPPVAAA